MELELVITSYQRLSPTVTSRMRFQSGQRYTLGRSKDCDWYLPDPDRIISSRHAEVFAQDGQFRVKDTSTNGIFINGATAPLGQGDEAALNDGDRLRFGDYEFGVNLAPESSADSFVAEPVITPRQPAATPTSSSALGDVPIQESMGGNPMLASGLGEQRLGDSHVEVPAIEIPTAWKWGDGGNGESRELSEPAAKAKPAVAPDHLTALFEGLGMPQLSEQAVSPALMREFGELTRILLDHLLDLLHARAEQKQKLRVTQTLFQRSENNPLKFSVTAQDALEALLVRRHGSFMGHREAVKAAFDDVMTHERALMAGVERVVTEILQGGGDGIGKTGLKRLSLLKKARAYDALIQRRALYNDEFGDTNRMLCSDAFVEAYESAVRKFEQEL